MPGSESLTYLHLGFVDIWVLELHLDLRFYITSFEIVVILPTICLKKKAKHSHYERFSWFIEFFLPGYSFSKSLI